MKKIIALFAIIVAFFGLAGCFDSADETFEIAGYPKTTYVLDETFSWDGVSVRIGEEYYNYAQAEEKGVQFPTVEEIKTDKAGTYSLTVKYGNLTATFQYNVLDSYFANGDGTLYNPYQISTLAQFNAMRKSWSQKTYFVLINDIDYTGNHTATNTTKNIVLDGQGYALRNVNSAIFYSLRYSEVKNLNIYFGQGEDNFDFAGYWTTMVTMTNYSATYENINTYGRVLAPDWANTSLYGYATSSTNVLKNCNNYADIMAVNCREVAVFTTGANSSKTNPAAWYILGCKNYGTVFASSASFIVSSPNYIGPSYGANYVIDENTKNYGKIISTLHQSSALYGNTTGAYNDRFNGNYENEWSYMATKFPTSKFYKYNEEIGVVSSYKIRKAGFEELGQDGLDGLTTVDMLHYQMPADVLTLTLDEENNIVLNCTQADKVDYFAIKFDSQLHSRTLEGNIKAGYAGSTSNGAYYSTTCKTVEEVNALGLKGYGFVNVVDGSVTLPAFQNEGSFQTSVVDKIVALGEGVTLDETGAIPTITIEGETFYAHNIVDGDGYSFVQPGATINVTVTAMSASGLPLGSVQIKIVIK